jgi:hypothetical protein
MVDTPEPVELRTGTPIRDRVLASLSSSSLPEEYIKVADRIGSGENEVLIYHAMFPRPEFVVLAMAIMGEMKMSAGRISHNAGLIMNPHEFLHFIAGMAGKWRKEVLNAKERDVLGRYLRFRRRGKDQTTILRNNPFFRTLPMAFSFLFHEVEFDPEEIFELAEIEARIPIYYKPEGHSIGEEQRRRNPRYNEQVAELLARGSL